MLVKHTFADAGEAYLGLLCACALCNLLTEIIEKVYGLVNEVCNFVGVLAGVYVQEEGAVIYECADHVLNVFFDVS